LAGSPFFSSNDADEYALGADEVAVVYRNGIPARLIENCRIASSLGIDIYGGVPQAATVEPSGKASLVFRRDDGRTLGLLLKEEPLQIARSARLMAAHHKFIHEKRAPGELRSQRDHLRGKIAHAHELDARCKRQIFTLLNNLPEDDRLCHGDLGLLNTYLAGARTCSAGWQDMARGNPLCDVARTSLLFTSAYGGADFKSRLVRAYLKIGNRAYLKAYAENQRACRLELQAWRVINAAARLAERVDCKPLLARIVRTHLPSAMRRFS
jgi:hypothetical protein